MSVVGAARILAYANERVAHELAKALPLALLFLLLTGGDPDLEAKMAGLDERNSVAPTETTLVFLVSLEVGLRILTDGSNESWPGPGVDEASTLTSASGVRGRLPSAWIMALATSSRRQTAD